MIDRDVRLAIYRALIATGRAPSVEGIAGDAGVAPDDVPASLERLADSHVIVLDPQTRGLWMAMPFSAVPTNVVVRTSERAYYANCAWDAFGIVAALHVAAKIDASCPDCGEPIAVEVDGGVAAAPPPTVAHFAVPARDWWRDIGFT